MPAVRVRLDTHVYLHCRVMAIYHLHIQFLHHVYLHFNQRYLLRLLPVGPMVPKHSHWRACCPIARLLPGRLNPTTRLETGAPVRPCSLLTARSPFDTTLLLFLLGPHARAQQPAGPSFSRAHAQQLRGSSKLDSSKSNAVRAGAGDEADATRSAIIGPFPRPPPSCGACWPARPPVPVVAQCLLRVCCH